MNVHPSRLRGGQHSVGTERLAGTGEWVGRCDRAAASRVTLAPVLVNTRVRDNGLVTHPAQPRRLEIWPCQSICVWQPTGQIWRDDRYDDLVVFACRGCGSEWVRTEPWTPIDSNGAVPTQVADEARRR